MWFDKCLRCMFCTCMKPLIVGVLFGLCICSNIPRLHWLRTAMLVLVNVLLGGTQMMRRDKYYRWYMFSSVLLFAYFFDPIMILKDVTFSRKKGDSISSSKPFLEDKVTSVDSVTHHNSVKAADLA
ncbi:hypothetical protein QVD17_30387 [Tagetes erecta]|uniref:Uncharacterized protein n=1 Tax=Tagetes erecta TaxID=13708 RepID=A0AAD8K3K1_TARER|nr:hypothetical protein QVD17_30387 [Tagetes erecta]